MFWGERGGGTMGRRNGKKRKGKDEEERSYRWLVFFCCCYEFGWCFLEVGGVEMRWWGMEGLLQVSFFFFFFFMISVADDHVDHHICTCLILS